MFQRIAVARRAGPDTTRALLTCGLSAGPIYVAISLAQALGREGFDITRHAWSLLANGDLGWIQMVNLITVGALTLAAAVGMSRALRAGAGRTWIPVLIGVYGLSLIAAGLFRADPMDGFPIGTPAGPPATISWHGIAHLVAGAIGFLALIVGCFVFARRSAAAGERGWMAFSIATGVFYLGAFAGIASGSNQPAIVLAFVAAVIIGWSWLAAVAARLRRETR